MIPAKDIREWQGLAVVDANGAKIGSLEGVYFDTASQEAAVVSVKSGFPGVAKLIFVPLVEPTVSPKHLATAVDRKIAKDAPSVDLGGELTADLEPQIYAHFGLPYALGAGGERKLGRR